MKSEDLKQTRRVGSRRNLSSAGLGVILVLVTAVWVLDHLDTVDVRSLFGYWPFLLIALGTTLLWGRRQQGEPKTGLILIVIGVVFLSRRMHELSLTEFWPLALVAAGAILVWMSFDHA